MAKRKYQNRGNNRGGGTAAKSKHTGAKVIAAMALLLAMAYVITSLALGMVWNPLKWVKGGDVTGGQEEPNKTEIVAVSSDGKKLLTNNSYAMPQAMAFVQKQSTYSKSKEFTVTATLSNEYINGVFDWAVSFVNPSSAWATGKVADYYVQATPTTDGSATATIKYISSFNEPINVTATLRGTDKSDSCQIDCLKDLEMVSVWSDSNDFGDRLEGGCELESTTGTIFAQYRVQDVHIYFDFSDDVQKYLKFEINPIYYYHFKDELVSEIMGIEEQSDNRLQLSYFSESKLTYSAFIENFDAFDDAHKEAVYYAWYHAAKETGYMMIYLNLSLYVNGVDTGLVVNHEERHRVSGVLYGKDVQPNVTLNQNVIF